MKYPTALADGIKCLACAAMAIAFFHFGEKEWSGFWAFMTFWCLPDNKKDS